MSTNLEKTDTVQKFQSLKLRLVSATQIHNNGCTEGFLIARSCIKLSVHCFLLLFNQQDVASIPHTHINDYNQEIYGEWRLIQSHSAEDRTFSPVHDINPALAGSNVWVRARVHNVRAQGLCFSAIYAVM